MSISKAWGLKGAAVTAFLLCQLYVVLFIALHDWLPLGSLNNLAGIRAVDTRMQLVRTTVLSALPFAVGLAGSVLLDHAFSDMAHVRSLDHVRNRLLWNSARLVPALPGLQRHGACRALP